MELKDFEVSAHKVVDWMCNYLKTVEDLPVKSQVAPGEISGKLTVRPPDLGQPFDLIMRDLDETLMPGVTHWQHPMFYAYFPANSSPPSILAEMITATLGLQCMLWETSPAATELEQRVLEWLRDMTGLPESFTGVIQDTASVATLCSILNAREKATGYRANERGVAASDQLVVYASIESHSSVDKAVRIAGIGSNNLRKIAVDAQYAMRVDLLERAIQEDIARGYKPVAIVATLGTTGCAAVDPLRAIGEIAKRYSIWLHVDAAYAGSALILPELRWLIEGIEYVDSIVFNPHKWLMVNFDCSAFYVRDARSLEKTFEIYPEYLKTGQGAQVCDFRNFGLQLGRRFRALKLWMVIRSYGVKELQSILRNHLQLAAEVEKWFHREPDFEVLAPRHLSLVCFRYHPLTVKSETQLDALNQRLLFSLNASGALYLTHTKLHERYTLRMVVGQTYTTREHVHRAYATIVAAARSLGDGQ